MATVKGKAAPAKTLSTTTGQPSTDLNESIIQESHRWVNLLQMESVHLGRPQTSKLPVPVRCLWLNRTRQSSISWRSAASVAVEVQDSVNSSSEIPVTQPPKLATNLNVIQSVTSISSDHEPEIEAEPPPQEITCLQVSELG